MINNRTVPLNINNFKLCLPYLIIILFSITFFVYGPLLRKHYALDTYVAEAYGNQANQQIELGRFFSGTILKVFTALGVNTAAHQSYFTFPSLCLLALSIYLLVRLFFGLREEWDIKSFVLLCLSCVVSLCNVFMLHWFLFPEVVIFMMTGLILSILALFLLRDSGALRWILCYVLLLAAVSFYQAVGAFFVTFGMLYIAMRRARQSPASVLRGFIAVFIVYGLAGITNVLLMTWHGRTTDRTSFQHTNPLKNIYGIIGSLQEKLQSTNLGAAPIYAFISLIFFLLVCGSLLLWKSADKKGLFQILFVLVALTIGSFAATMAPHLLTSTVDMSPRSIVALMSLPGVISLFMLSQPGPFNNKPLFSHLLLGFLLVFLFVNTYIIYSVEVSRFATNRLDKEIARMVYQEILQYEKETGNTVRRIAFRHDEEPTLCYPGLICYGNFRAMGRDWTIVPLISLVSGRSFIEASMPDSVYDIFFKGKNWNLYSKEQIMLQGDTLNLMLY